MYERSENVVKVWNLDGGKIKSPHFVKDNSGFQHESENNSQLYPKKLKIVQKVRF